MVNFSEEHLALIKDADFLLEKKKASERIIQILGEAERELKPLIHSSQFQFPIKTHIKAGKISKGESYQDLPYFVLDFPRLFSQNDIFAFRVMLWWGHEISYTFLLAGESRDVYHDEIKNHKKSLADYFICVHQSPWEHHFKPDNYVQIGTIGTSEFEKELSKDFIKISTKKSLDQITHIPIEASKQLSFYLKILGT